MFSVQYGHHPHTYDNISPLVASLVSQPLEGMDHVCVGLATPTNCHLRKLPKHRDHCGPPPSLAPAGAHLGIPTEGLPGWAEDSWWEPPLLIPRRGAGPKALPLTRSWSWEETGA